MIINRDGARAHLTTDLIMKDKVASAADGGEGSEMLMVADGGGGGSCLGLADDSKQFLLLTSGPCRRQ